MRFLNTSLGLKRINKAEEPITKVLRVSATNILFKTSDEQFRIIESFAKMLNSLTVPIQILCSSEDMKAEDWQLNVYNQDYLDFLKEQISHNQITSKEFKVVVSHYDEYIIDNTLKVIERCLKSCGLEFDKEYEIINYKSIKPEMHPNCIKIGGYYHATLFVQNWSHSCTAGWLNDIYNNEMNINVSMFVNPVPKPEALDYLKKRLARNVANSMIDLEKEDLDVDMYDEYITSALLMRDELHKNNGKFFFMSYYITVKADCRSKLKRHMNYIKTILGGMDIEAHECYLRHDDGYKCTQPFCIDFLDKKYNFTTEPLKHFFPFISSNILDQGGILVGRNQLNSSLVFLNPFKYNSALMFVLGKVGGGKSYFAKLMCLRMLYMGVQIDIWDKDGEYLELKKLTNLPNLRIHNYKDQENYRREMQRYLKEMDANKLQPRFLIIDEFWKYLDDEVILQGINRIALEGRKKYQGMCVISQQVEHLLKDDKALAILHNASIKALMQMETTAAKIAQETLTLTDEEVAFLVSAQHEGILFAGSKHVQFKAMGSENEDKIINTNPVLKAQRLIYSVPTPINKKEECLSVKFGIQEAAATRSR